MTDKPVRVPRLSMRSISKTFGPAKVLDDVSLDVMPGEIHGLVGQNGSGKSTLIKILSGFHAPDPNARIAIDGHELSVPIEPRQLQEHGVAFVHQDLGLDLTANVIENVRIGMFEIEPLTRRIRWKREAVTVAAALADLHANRVSPYAVVGTLNHAERASVAIARALQNVDPGEGVVVFDESTQSLPRDILHEFYEHVRAIARTGTAVIIVSHRLDEVLALCDTVTVLEDGKLKVAGAGTAGMTEAALTRLIIGRDAFTEPITGSNPVIDTERETAIDVRDLSSAGLDGVDLRLHNGEVVGLIGTSDSGYDLLPYALAGVRSVSAGTIDIDGESFDATSLSPTQAMRLGIGFVPGDRSGQGLASNLTSLENLTLPRTNTKAIPVVLKRGWQLDEFRSIVRRLGVTPAAPDLPISSFSGGNQQKILLGKWLLNQPRVLVLHEPTQAVDVGAREDILSELRRQADEGVAVLIASLEAQDLAAVCDRVLVMENGRITKELRGSALTAHHIIETVYADTDEQENNHVAA